MIFDPTRSFDVVIIGGAVIGSAAAYFLTADSDFDGSVLVIEKDPTYAFCATARSAGSIRQQFSTAENIAISLFGIDFLRHCHETLAVAGEGPDIGLKERGYLFLATEAGRPILERNHALQTEMGADIQLLERETLRAKFPWLNTEDLALGSWGRTGEGWLDPYALMQGFRKKAIAQGAHYERAEAIGLERNGGKVTAVQLADGRRVGCSILINAAGLFGHEIAETAGLSLPVSPRKRQVFVLDCQTPLPGCPLVIDHSGAYLRPEGQHYICGIQPPEDQDPETRDSEVDHDFFEAQLWPILSGRVPALEAVKVVNAWAGHYDMNLFDANAILGPHPEVENFLFANGFSGHGLQQSPAVGRALSELVVHGRFTTLDLGRFGYRRLIDKTPIREENVV